MITLRPYQQETRYQTNTLLNANRHPLIVKPTGCGKTKTATKIIEDRIGLGKRVFVIVPQSEIFSQWMEDLAYLNPGYCNDEGFRGTDRNVYVCMMLSLFNNLPMIPESLYPDEVWTDEAHHSSCTTLEGVYSFFENALRVGLTATPLRTDGKPLGHLYTDIVQTINIREALDNNYLTEPVMILPDEWVLDIPEKGSDYDPEKQAELLGEPKIIGDVLHYYERTLCGKPCLVACSTFDHANVMTKQFNDAGWIAEHIHSNLPNHERKSILARVRSGKVNLLCTVGIGIEGMDIPGLYGLIWLRRTKSLTIWKQFNGRVMRLAEGKKDCIIIDPMGNTVIHGAPDRVFKWSLTQSVEEVEKEPPVPFQKCYSCGTYNAVENHECHWCGADLSDEARLSNKKPRQLPTMIDGKMVAITTDGEIQDIKDRAERIKAEQKEMVRVEKEKMESAETVTQVDKRKALKEGLFSNSVRRSLFQDAIGGW